MRWLKNDFGTVDGQPVYTYTLENDRGMKLTCSNFGCLVTEIVTQDRDGNFENIVLGFNRVDDYIRNKTYFGASIGRVAGRIAGSEFELDGVRYTLPSNDGENHLHGGLKGLHERIFDAEPFVREDGVGVTFSYVSEDGEEGYPGTVRIEVTYLLNNNNQWVFTCKGVTDRKTLLNITNHSYFNLSGNAKRDILNHELVLKSDRYLTLTDALIPTGEMKNAESTVFDFRNGRQIIDGHHSDDPQNVLAGNGYDHPFLLSGNFNQEILLKDSASGRTLTIETNQPAVVLYTGNQISGDYIIQGGVEPKKYLALCLETQGLPDAIHHPHFPSIVVTPEEPYFAKTIYSFDVEN